MNIHIELTTREDIFKECAVLMSRSEPWITLNRDYDKCLKAMQGDYKEVYIAMEDGQLLGFVVLQMAGTFRGYIQTICISPDQRGKGIGKVLLKYAEERIFRISPNVFMCVSSFNSNAAKLYYSLGYEKIADLKDFIVKGYSEYLLRKTIGPTSEFIAQQ